MAARIPINRLNDFNFPRKVIMCLEKSGINMLRLIQFEALKKGLFENYSFMVSTPSGSGKTLIGELAALHQILNHHLKALYLVPLKALATEKYRTFNQKYQSLNLKIKMAVGDQDISYSELGSADLLIMTYEKFDSYLRSKIHFDWIHKISTLIVDEIHILGDKKRGPRLENLILRIYRLKYPPQLIYLSATIANTVSIRNWFDNLEKKYRKKVLKSILENKRPVPLHFTIRHSRNKIGLIESICKKNLENMGQILIFTNSRKDTMNLCEELSKNPSLQSLLKITKQINPTLHPSYKNLTEISPDISQVVYWGVAYHHAGLNSYEREYIESLFRDGAVKILCTTNTLSAGINTPTRTVIIKNISLYHSKNSVSPDTRLPLSRFEKKPMGKNLFHQICGRAGRPGYDVEGNVYILAKNVEERVFIEDNYFQRTKNNQLIPIYEQLKSSLPKNNDLLQEIVLLKAFETEDFTVQDFVDFIQDSLMWHQVKDKNIPLKAYLNLHQLNYIALLKALSTKQQIIFINQLLFSIEYLEFNPMEYLKLKIELSINQDSNLTKLLNYDNNNSFLENNDMKLQSNQLKNNSNPVEIQFSTTNGIKCSCQECRLKRSRKNIELNSRLLSKQCIYVISTIFAFKNITDSIIGNIQAPKQILIAANEYKEEIFEKNDQFEVFFNKTIFSQTIIDKLLVYKVIRKTKTLINSYSCTRLGKLGLQSYLIPRIVHELDNSLRAIFQHQTEIRNEDLIPIFKKILVKQEKKVFENLASGIELWIQELPIEKIIKEMNMRSQPRIIYISDFYAIIESITRLYKFTREYLRTFYPEYDPLDIEKMHIQIRYGIKEDLIDWMKIFKDEDPKVFRKFIDNGVSTPTEFVKRTPDELEKLRIISYNTIRFLQNIATSIIGSNKKLYS